MSEVTRLLHSVAGPVKPMHWRPSSDRSIAPTPPCLFSFSCPTFLHQVKEVLLHKKTKFQDLLVFVLWLQHVLKLDMQRTELHPNYLYSSACCPRPNTRHLRSTAT